MTFTPWTPTLGNVAPPLTVAQGGTGQITALAGLTALGGMPIQATTGTAGYTLVNGTGNVLTWTPPNDGGLHRFLLLATLNVTSAETGGQMNIAFNLPNATASNIAFFSGQGLGLHQSNFNGQVQAGTTVTVSQNTALTVGAAVLWMDLLGL